MFSKPCFILFYPFLFRHFFSLRLLITPLVSSNVFNGCNDQFIIVKKKSPLQKLDLTFRLAGMLSLVVCINVWSKSTNRTNFFVFNNLFSSSLPISLACWKCILYINIAKVNLHKNCQFKKINGLTGKNIWYFDILNWLKYNYKTNELVLYSLNENEFFIVVFHWSQMSQYSLLSLEYCDTCLFVSFLPLSCIVCIIDISYCMATVMYIICCKL